jgi:hypothetical protein
MSNIVSSKITLTTFSGSLKPIDTEQPDLGYIPLAVKQYFDYGKLDIWRFSSYSWRETLRWSRSWSTSRH